MRDAVQPCGTLVISLDFELYWGVRDKRSLAQYSRHLLGAREVIPRLLKLFTEYGIHATWASVGMLFYETREELLKNLPGVLPEYENQIRSPYPYVRNIGKDEQEDPFHFASSLLKKIIATSYQEVGSHTFSHYYCNERGQTLKAFREDLTAALGAAGKLTLRPRSLVFPRNQVNPRHLAVCAELGFDAYRGNMPNWLFQARSEDEETLFRRIIRVLDAYINLSGHNTYSVDTIKKSRPINVPASRFLRAHSPRLKFFERGRLKRIQSDLNAAAERGEIYHLWWHPHNFGALPDENLQFLRKVLDCYREQKNAGRMQSLNMGELAQKILAG